MKTIFKTIKNRRSQTIKRDNDNQQKHKKTMIVTQNRQQKKDQTRYQDVGQ